MMRNVGVVSSVYHQVRAAIATSHAAADTALLLHDSSCSQHH